MLTAIVAPVKIGHLEIEGLLFPDGSLGVAVPQLTALNLVPPNRSLKQLEDLLAIRFQSHQKAKTALNPKAVNVINLDELTDVVVASANQGNLTAQALRDSLVGLSLVQLFSDAFNIKFEKEERQDWLEKRQATIAKFWFLGDSIKPYLARHSELSDNYRHWIYSNCQDAINVALFGKKAKKIREILGVTNLLRDHYGKESLDRLVLIQDYSSRLIDNQDIEPLEAVHAAAEFYQFEIIHFEN